MISSKGQPFAPCICAGARQAAHGPRHQGPRRQPAPNGTTSLAFRYLRGYALRSYRLAPAGHPLILSGPMRPDLLLSEPRVEQRFDADNYMPYWSEVWPASAGLSDYLLDTHLRPAGAHRLAVELGCGLGLAGVAAGMLGWRVLFTDYDLDALAYAAFNAASNSVRDYGTLWVDWREPPAGLHADLVLAADVLYEKKMHGALLGCVEAVLAPAGVAIIADPQRDGAKGFAAEAVQRGWAVSHVAWADRQATGHAIPVDVHILRKRSGRPLKRA